MRYCNRPCAVIGYDDLTCREYIGLIYRATIDGELRASEYYIRLAMSCNAVDDLVLAAKEIRAEQQQQAELSDEWEDQIKTKYGVPNPFVSHNRSGEYVRVLPDVVAPRKKMFPQ